jgi:hypothetical protein
MNRRCTASLPASHQLALSVVEGPRITSHSPDPFVCAFLRTLAHHGAKRALCFHILTHSFAQRALDKSFGISHIRTLCVTTGGGGVPPCLPRARPKGGNLSPSPAALRQLSTFRPQPFLPVANHSSRPRFQLSNVSIFPFSREPFPGALRTYRQMPQGGIQP